MKVLLLALILGLVCASQEGESENQLSPEVTGEWYTIYQAADNREKIAEDGPLRCYLRWLEYNDDSEDITFDFYVKADGECEKHTIVGRRQENNVYTIDYSGKNYFDVWLPSSNVIVVVNTNEDEEGKTTNMMELFSKTKDVSPEDYQNFEKLVSEKEIPTENIIKVIDTDTCPGNIN